MKKSSLCFMVILTIIMSSCNLTVDKVVNQEKSSSLSRGTSTIYYIDSVNGNDSSSGNSENSPWKTLTKVNSITYQPGDKILFKANGTWNGQLYPKGSGSSGSPIIIDMYGSGNRPLIAANGTKHNTLYFRNQEYWEINNLEITNTANDIGDYRGITIEGRDYGKI